MKKLTLLASAIALTFCAGQSVYSDEISSDTGVDTKSEVSVDTRSELIQRIENQLSELREYQARKMSERTTFEWFGFILNVANSIIEALVILDPNSPEIAALREFVREVERIRARIPEGASPGEVITTDKLTQDEKDQISRIKAQFAALIERLETLRDELKNNKSKGRSSEKEFSKSELQESYSVESDMKTGKIPTSSEYESDETTISEN